MAILLSTAIPYVNAAPHLGHALELVQADVLARHARARGQDVRFISGTDDHSLKNVLAARAAGIPTADFVRHNAEEFQRLLGPLDVDCDDYIRTSDHPRHRANVEAIWRACAADLYQRDYTGDYCVGCEAFVAGSCPEHPEPPERVSERNWFFRLSRYTEPLLDALTSGRLRVEPEARRNEVIGFVRQGLRDFSVSRDASRAGRWGIPVPGDPGQVVYVWFDALVNYVTGADGQWPEFAARHVIGKGILRFHAVYWPAILLSAGLPLPESVLVHDYLSVSGAKIAKSAGNGVDPVELVGRYGVDAVRWWLTSEVPRVGDVDFTEARLVARYDADLASGLGNLASRVARLRGTPGTPEPFAERLHRQTAGKIDAALDRFDFRSATDAIRNAVAEANRYAEFTQPWKAADPAIPLATLISITDWLAAETAPFLPSGARRLTEIPGGAFRRGAIN